MEGIVVQGEPSLSLLLCKFMVKVGIIRTITIGKHNNNKSQIRKLGNKTHSKFEHNSKEFEKPLQMNEIIDQKKH